MFVRNRRFVPKILHFLKYSFFSCIFVLLKQKKKSKFDAFAVISKRVPESSKIKKTCVLPPSKLYSETSWKRNFHQLPPKKRKHNFLAKNPMSSVPPNNILCLMYGSQTKQKQQWQFLDQCKIFKTTVLLPFIIQKCYA